MAVRPNQPPIRAKLPPVLAKLYRLHVVALTVCVVMSGALSSVGADAIALFYRRLELLQLVPSTRGMLEASTILAISGAEMVWLVTTLLLSSFVGLIYVPVRIFIEARYAPDIRANRTVFFILFFGAAMSLTCLLLFKVDRFTLYGINPAHGALINSGKIAAANWLCFWGFGEAVSFIQGGRLRSNKPGATAD
jgi:hypothetical protein